MNPIELARHILDETSRVELAHAPEHCETLARALLDKDVQALPLNSRIAYLEGRVEGMEEALKLTHPPEPERSWQITAPLSQWTAPEGAAGNPVPQSAEVVDSHPDSATAGSVGDG